MFTTLTYKIKIIGLFLLSLLFTCFTFYIPANASNQHVHVADEYISSSIVHSRIAQLSDKKLTKQPFYWNSIDVAIEVQDNGDMWVTETQEYVFNQEHTNQRYRYIPLDKVDKITDVTVRENNQIIPSQVGKKNNQLWIKWEHELNPPESHTFVIKYRVVGGLHVNTDNTQVYWKAIFSDRKSPIQNAKVTVKLPESLAGKITSFNHFPANVPTSSQQIDERTIEFIAQQSISQGQELEVKVTFPNNILQMSKPNWQKFRVFNDWVKIIFALFFILILLIFIVSISSSSGKRSNSSRSRGYYGGGGG
ncbi:MAG: DUF2207 domain-containing protein, partial [Cyanobacteria bacterium P01_A01_bin.83]